MIVIITSRFLIYHESFLMRFGIIPRVTKCNFGHENRKLPISCQCNLSAQLSICIVGIQTQDKVIKLTSIQTPLSKTLRKK